MSFNIRVPTNWKEPQGDPDAQHYRDAFKASEKNTTPGSPPLFQAASMNKYHTDAQKMLISGYGDFIDKTCDAICFAWDKWQSTATMAGIIVAASMGNAGQVVGVPLMPLILAKGAMSSPMQMKYTTVIATVIGTQWLAYTATIKMVAMQLWPMFNAFPSPVVPPTPCVPMPFSQMIQVPTLVSCNVMKSLMMAMHADPMAPFASQLFEAICDAFEKAHTQWVQTTMVTNVLGIGAVPTCVPPIMAPGPVVGTAIMTPGGFK